MLLSSPFLQALILVTALSVDSLVASFAYGTQKVNIPFSSLAVMDGMTSGILLLFLLLGKVISPFLPAFVIRFICFGVLFFLGLVKLFDSYIKLLIRKSGQNAPVLQFSLLQFQFILTVYADPDKANSDGSNTLSPREAVSLGAALSLDSAAAGFGAGVTALSPLLVGIQALAVGGLAILAGCFLGNKLAERTQLNLSWLSGALLILLAFLKFR